MKAYMWTSNKRQTRQTSASISGFASADHVMTLIAFAASAGVSPIELVATIDAGPGRKDRFIRQSIELPSEVLSTRLLEKETFDALWNAFDRTSNEQQQRLARMFHWFRKGALDEYAIDKFIDGWTALEVLNPLIKKKHGLPDQEVKRMCDKCGEPVVTAPTSAGIRSMIAAAKDGSAWKNANRRRQKLIHGHAPIADAVSGIDSDISVLFDAARGGALDLIDIESKWPDFRRSLMNVPKLARAMLEWKLLDADRSEIGYGADYPQLELVSSHGEIGVGDEGRTREHLRLEYRPANFDRRWEPLALEVQADRDPDDPDASVTIA
jgi:hypothetical protein